MENVTANCETEQHSKRGQFILGPQFGQPMQLTPLWQYVVRTRQFPPTIDPEYTFHEISQRLRDPEWEVRQHALRVLVDALPAVEQNSVDKLMVPVFPELVTNLGHSAPAVRKGALDTLQVYLCCSQDTMKMFQKILDNGFNRPDALDNLQSNIGVGVIVGIPSLLFSSAGNLKPSKEMLKFTINALASRMVQVTHQEAVLRSLAHIREKIGTGDFDSNLLDYNANLKRDFEVLCEVHNVKISKDKNVGLNDHQKYEEVEEIVPLMEKWGSDSDTCGATNDGRNQYDEHNDVLVELIPPARVVVETEIKFYSETAISMTILEEEKNKKNEADTESDSVSESNFSDEDVGIVQILEDIIPEKRNIRRRVHFGGEVVKLRTPDTDDEIIGRTPEVPKTRIPVPVHPATKMPLDRRRSHSSDISPNRFKHPRRRSPSSSSKRKVYTHNALLRPQKSILMKANSPLYVVQPVEPRKEHKWDYHDKTSSAADDIQINLMHSEQIKDGEVPKQSVSIVENGGKVMSKNEEQTYHSNDEKKETKKIVQSVSCSQKQGLINNNFGVKSRDARGILQSGQISIRASTPRKSSKCPCQPSSRINFDVFPKQERNYILMELSSSERKTDVEKNASTNESSADFSRFTQVVTDALFGMNISTPRTEILALDQFLNHRIDSAQTGTNQRSAGLHVNWSESRNITSRSSQDLHSEKSVIPFAAKKSSERNFGQLPRDVDATSTSSACNKKSENNVYAPNIVLHKNQSFRELAVGDGCDKSTLDESESLNCSSSEGDVEKPVWKKLGLVDPVSLNDVHNKIESKTNLLLQLGAATKMKSRIPVLRSRYQRLLTTEARPGNLDGWGAGFRVAARSGVALHDISCQKTRCSELTQRSNVSYVSMYHRRKPLTKRSVFQVLQPMPDAVKQCSCPKLRHQPSTPSRKLPTHVNRDMRITKQQSSEDV
nr:uncharacterized protein LOC124224746 [Neodiprion pinetum]